MGGIMDKELPTLESLDNIVSIAEGWIKTLPEYQQEIYWKAKEVKAESLEKEVKL